MYLLTKAPCSVELTELATWMIENPDGKPVVKIHENSVAVIHTWFRYRESRETDHPVDEILNELSRFLEAIGNDLNNVPESPQMGFERFVQYDPGTLEYSLI